MALSHALSTNNYGICKFIVDSSAALGTHVTLASAMADAVSGDTILMRVSVTENVTLTPGVNIVGLIGSELTPTISITGKLTMTGAGTCTISGIRLTTNSDFFLAVTGTAVSIVNLENCYLNCLNNTGISHTSSGSGSFVIMRYCSGNIATTGISLFASTSSSPTTIQMFYCEIAGTGGSVTASTSTAANVLIRHCFLAFSVTLSNAAGMNAWHSTFNSGNFNLAGITMTGTGIASFDHCDINGGTASALSIGAGCSIDLRTCSLRSSNTNVATGAGTIQYTAIGMYTSSVMNVTTQTPAYTQLGKYKASGQPGFSAYFASSATNVTGNGTNYFFGDTDVGGGVSMTEIYDQGGDFVTGSSSGATLTAPVDGKWVFSASCLILQIGTGTSLGFAIATSNLTFRAFSSDPSANDNSDQLGFNMTIQTNMDAADTCTVFVGVNGTGADTVDVYGGGSDPRSTFSGWQIG